MAQYNEYEPAQSWKLSVCEKCGALLYIYETADGNVFATSVYEGFEYHRHGNNKNYVAYHECDGDKGQSKTRKRLYVETVEVSDEVNEKVSGALAQQAVMRALSEDCSKAKKGFKKSIHSQAINFLAGKSQYSSPFSAKQIDSIMRDYIVCSSEVLPKSEEENDANDQCIEKEEYVCQICGKDCKGPGRFHQHMKLKHPEIEIY